MNSMLRFTGVALVVLGVVFLFWGFDLSHSFSNRFMKEMAGDYPEETKRYIFGGIGMIIAGLGCFLYSFKRR